MAAGPKPGAGRPGLGERYQRRSESSPNWLALPRKLPHNLDLAELPFSLAMDVNAEEYMIC